MEKTVPDLGMIQFPQDADGAAARERMVEFMSRSTNTGEPLSPPTPSVKIDAPKVSTTPASQKPQMTAAEFDAMFKKQEEAERPFKPFVMPPQGRGRKPRKKKEPVEKTPVTATASTATKDTVSKKDLSDVKTRLTGIKTAIKTGNAAQVKILNSIAKKLDDAKKTSKEKSSNANASVNTKTVEKLLTATNSHLTRLIGKLDVFGNKLSNGQSVATTAVSGITDIASKLDAIINKIDQKATETTVSTGTVNATAQQTPSNAVISQQASPYGTIAPVNQNIISSPMPVTPTVSKKIPKSEPKQEYKAGFITNQASAMATALLGRGAGNLTHKVMSSAGKLASSLVTRKDIERKQERAETKTWRKKVIDLLSGKQEATTSADPADKKGSGSLIGSVLSIAAALAAAAAIIAPEKTIKLAKAVGSTIATAPATIRAMGIPGQEYINQETGKEYKSERFGGIQRLGEGVIKGTRLAAQGVAATVIAGEKAVDWAQEQTKKLPSLIKGIEASVAKFATSAANLPEQLAGKLAQGALDISTGILNAITGLKDSAVDKVNSAIDSGKQGVDITKKAIKDGTSKANKDAETSRQNFAEKVLGIKKEIPKLEVSKPIFTPMVANLNAAQNSLANLEQREKDASKQSMMQMVNSGNTTVVQGGGNGESGIRLSPRNIESTKRTMDFISLNVGGMGRIIN